MRKDEIASISEFILSESKGKFRNDGRVACHREFNEAISCPHWMTRTLASDSELSEECVKQCIDWEVYRLCRRVLERVMDRSSLKKHS